MTTLTTRQRDILQLLLEAEAPMGSADLAEQLQLTPRQITYGLKGLKQWLAGKNIKINSTPGVGVTLNCTSTQYNQLTGELTEDSLFQLVLTVEQRQQLLALILLVTNEPFILYQLQQLSQVSRTTILKDLDAISEWVQEHGLTLERRPNYGVWIEGSEQAKRQTIAAWLWGQTPLGTPLTNISHVQGLVFDLSNDVEQLPIIDEANQIISQWATKRAFGYVAYAEAQLDGRFNDDAVLHLALVLAIQIERVQSGYFLTFDDVAINWLKTLSVWPVATQIARRLGWKTVGDWPQAEIAGIALHLLAAPRNDRWPGDLEIDSTFSNLIEVLMEHISQTYQLPELKEDTTLRDGIIIHTIPTCLQHRFNLWFPTSLPGIALSEKYSFEHQVANELTDIITEHTGVILPDSDINNIAMLLRAAFIRKQPNQVQEVVVVCPSGMATAQLLVARLKARFPRIGTLKVVSFRELNPTKLAGIELIITTIPLPSEIHNEFKVIQVHPLLLPEDIEHITQWLA